MSKKLTEDMVISRTKISDLSKVKRLNCWGSELEDVSVLRKMPFVEVLSLSINKIHSLADFQFCKRLEELYIRQNDIRDVNEVMFLQNLPNLKNLWLDENPCAHVDGYRLAVIKALPQLQKLDNVTITREELQEAQRKGKTLYLPNEDNSDEEYTPSCAPQPSQRYENYSPECSPLPSYSIQKQEVPPHEYETEESEDVYPKDVYEENRDYSPPQVHTQRSENVRSYSPESDYNDRRSSYERELLRQNYEQESSGQPCEREYPSQQYYEDCTNGERYSSSHGVSENTSAPIAEKKERFSCPAAAHRPPFNRRPVTRNSNILSAVLCLVKELDYPSLEVVEMAVRCRMDELDE